VGRYAVAAILVYIAIYIVTVFLSVRERPSRP
jgi:hypothetical protein